MSNDLPNLGIHCSFDECNRLDFLPIKCDHCEKLFCKDHSNFLSHKCNKYVENSSHQINNLDQKRTVFYKCSFSECLNNTKEIVEIICDYCKLNHCMKHRLPIDHKCSIKESQDNEVERQAKLKEEQKQAQKKEFKFEIKQNVSEKNTALAAKLAIMKLKQTAQGPPGLPEETSAINKSPIYLNKKWPVGKCVEFLVEKLNLNKSNLLRIKLFINDNMIDSSYILDNYIKENSIIQGSSLELKLI